MNKLDRLEGIVARELGWPALTGEEKRFVEAHLPHLVRASLALEKLIGDSAGHVREIHEYLKSPKSRQIQELLRLDAVNFGDSLDESNAALAPLMEEIEL